MKIPKIVNAVSFIDDDLITEADGERTINKKSPLRRWLPAAAAVAVLALAAAVLLPRIGRDNKAEGRYGDAVVSVPGTAILWPWEDLTVPERYTELVADGVSYRSTGHEVSEELVGDIIGTYEVSGCDLFSDERHSESFEVYELLHADRSVCAAVRMEGTYYVFRGSEYDPPGTLGELLNLVDLKEVLPLERFSEDGDGPDAEHFILKDDGPVWEILANCREAAFVGEDLWTTEGREYLSFSLTSETLGIYKKAMYVTKDGYLWTNAFDWAYIFKIGEEAAGEIMAYAKENADPAVYEPYFNTVAGTVTEINDSYILLDDSVLCRDPADGIVYRIPLDDPRIFRYVKNNVVKVGDTIRVSYNGEIDEENAYTISGVTAIDEAFISGGNTYVPE
ncbi:MAG: hypothetical protein K6E30_07805 [Lachnospiraceae bacterium]|nr:hypothetical protein [Lachnospiraceae bacterium]